MIKKRREVLVKIPAGSVILEGNVIQPQGARGIVLFVHGSGSSRHSPRNQFVARELSKAGFATLLFDLLTTEEEISEAQTGHLRFNIRFLVDRLLAATIWVTKNPQMNHLPIGYFGASTGAAAALVAAVESSVRIDAIVSRGGRPDLAEDALQNVVTPTLFIVGGDDYEVIKLNQQAFLKLVKAREKELVIIPGATHLFEEPGTLEAVAQKACEWFTKYLRI